MKVSLLRIGVACLVLSAAMTALAQRQTGPRPGPRGPGGLDVAALLRLEQVQQEINLTEEQQTQIQALGQEQREAMRQRFEGLREMSPDERREAMAAMREQLAERTAEVRQKLAETLTDQQMQRLGQIRAQMEGERVLLRPAVQEQLGLSDAQKEKLSEIAEAGREKMRERFQAARAEDADREALRGQIQAAREEMQKDMMGVLTSEQRKQFGAQIMGEPFELDREALMRFGPGRERRTEPREEGARRGRAPQ